MSKLKRTVARVRADEAIEFRLIFLVCFTVFLVAALVARCLPRHWRPYPPGPRGSRSIIDEAKTAANECVPFAFMA